MPEVSLIIFGKSGLQTLVGSVRSPWAGTMSHSSHPSLPKAKSNPDTCLLPTVTAVETGPGSNLETQLAHRPHRRNKRTEPHSFS